MRALHTYCVHKVYKSDTQYCGSGRGYLCVIIDIYITSRVYTRKVV
jgi:hypothetical protein